MTDDEIIRLLEARRETALEALSAEYGGYCREIAYRLTGQPEDAEEIVNDLWLRVWESIPPQKPESLRHYLAKLTRNLAFDLLRKQRAEKRGGSELPLVLEELENCLPAGETPESALSAKKLGAAVNRFRRKRVANGNGGAIPLCARLPAGGAPVFYGNGGQCAWRTGPLLFSANASGCAAAASWCSRC